MKKQHKVVPLTWMRVTLAGIVALGSGCNAGLDRTPNGCTTRTLAAASYDAETNRLNIRLSDGPSYWTSSSLEYSSYRDKHVGPFERGATVIDCPTHSKVIHEIRSNVTGNLYVDFHLLRR